MGLPEATGVVLAGGRSTRFGRDKLAEPYLGMPLLHHAVLRLAEVCGDVVVVVAPDAVDPALPVGVPVRVARDATEGEGPLAGVYAGLLAVTTDVALVAGGDMPDLQTPVLLEMLGDA
ncbi:MAG: molybdenum cofactor guanylyltransferase, partial [Actinomycetota bacterium]